MAYLSAFCTMRTFLTDVIFLILIVVVLFPRFSCFDVLNIEHLLLLGHCNVNEREKGLRAGFRRYLIKPIKLTEFTKAIHELLEVNES